MPLLTDLDLDPYIPQHPQAFFICSIILMFFLNDYFSVISSNRIDDRFTKYSQLLRTKQVAGAGFYYAALFFFIISNLIAYWLLCLCPSVLVGLAKVYNETLSEQIDKYLKENIQTPIIIAALWLGFARVSAPKWIQISKITRDFFQRGIDAPQRLEETVAMVLNDFDVNLKTKDLWAARLVEFGSAEWKKKHASELSVVTLDSYFRTLKLDVPINELKSHEAEYSFREVRRLMEAAVLAITLATIEKSGWRGIKAVFPTSDQVRSTASEFLTNLSATAIMFSICMIATWALLEWNVAALLGIQDNMDSPHWGKDPGAIWSDMIQYAIPLCFSFVATIPLVNFDGPNTPRAVSGSGYLRDFFRNSSHALLLNWTLSTGALFILAFFAVGTNSTGHSDIEFYIARLVLSSAINGLSCSSVLFCVALCIAPGSSVARIGMGKSLFLLIVLSILFASAADVIWCVLLFCIRHRCDILYEHRLYQVAAETLVNLALFLSVSVFWGRKRTPPSRAPLRGLAPRYQT